MGKKNITSVAFNFPGDLIQYVSFTSDASLLDSDIIIFSPDIFVYSIQSRENYKGKPYLTDSASFALKEQTEYWRRELMDACRAGKTIFIFLEKFNEVFVATGEKTYSGTGSRRITTNIVTEHDNYRCLPFLIEPINSKGSSMIIIKNNELIANYWKEFEEYSEYHVFMKGKVSQPIITTKDGNRVLGAIVRLQSADGMFVLLPHLETDNVEFSSETEEGDILWSKKGIEFGKRLLASIIEMDKIAKAGNRVTPKPDWVNDVAYELPKEKTVREKLLTIELELQKINNEKESLKNELSQEISLKRLLYENGKPLENAIIDSLIVLGFKASGLREGESEFDVIFESPEGRLLGEAEGKDNKQINIIKLRQLEMNILEDFERNDVNEMAKGVLFGNASRLLPLKDRDADFFTKKCITAAKRNNTALVRTTDLFLITKYLLTKSDKTFARNCRETILKSEGDIVIFPKIPTAESSPKTKTESK